MVGNRLPAERWRQPRTRSAVAWPSRSGPRRIPPPGPSRAQAAVDAVHQAFAHGVAQTSLIGGIIMAAGTPIVLAVLPGRRGFARKSAEPGAGTTAS